MLKKVGPQASRSVRLICWMRNSYLLAVAFAWLCRVRFGLWRSPFQTLHQRLFQESQKPLFYPFRTRPSLQQLVKSVKVSARWMPANVKCLAKALCAQAIARQFDYRLDLHIGVAKQGDRAIAAHAWVVYQDRIVLGNLPDLDKFVPLSISTRLARSSS